uniref:Uncharacterized protein n=1 Tax=Aegilops tauschii subsp. strangulata TaxID=200361 RepID=A0A452XH16_AEGTS
MSRPLHPPHHSFFSSPRRRLPSTVRSISSPPATPSSLPSPGPYLLHHALPHILGQHRPDLEEEVETRRGGEEDPHLPPLSGSPCSSLE